MIAVTRDRSGLVKIDWSNDSEFLQVEGLSSELTAGLFVEKAEKDGLLIDDGGQLVAVLRYITELLEKNRIQVEVDSSLRQEADRIENEGSLVTAVRHQPDNEATETDAVVIPRLARELLPHQVQGVRHGLRVGNAANFSVPGSGKTTVALAIYAALKGKGIVDRLFVIGPASSFAPWEEEYEATFGSEPLSLRVVGPSYRRAQQLRDAERYDLVLCTYQMAHRERSNLKRAVQRCRGFLLLDESHLHQKHRRETFFKHCAGAFASS